VRRLRALKRRLGRRARRVFALYSNLEATATAFVALPSHAVHSENHYRLTTVLCKVPQAPKGILNKNLNCSLFIIHCSLKRVLFSTFNTYYT